MRRVLSALTAILCLLGVLVMPADASGAFTRDLWRASAHDPQKTWDTCTVATIRIARNLARGTSVRASRAQELAVYRAIRATPSRRAISSRGIDSRRWAEAMLPYGPGIPYADLTYTDGDDALRAIAYRLTVAGTAVGVEVADGRHAWLVVGVRTDRDPLLGGHFRVNAVRVVGPLTPLRFWKAGYDPKPGTWMSRKTFLRYFRRHTSDNDRRYRGKWVIVAPIVPLPTPSPTGTPTPSPTPTPTPTPSPTPEPTPTEEPWVDPTPTPAPTPTPTPSPTPSPTTEPVPSPTPTPEPDPTPV